MVDTLCKEGKVAEAKDMVIVTYSALIDGYWLSNKVKEAMQLSGDIVKRGFILDVWT